MLKKILRIIVVGLVINVCLLGFDGLTKATENSQNLLVKIGTSTARIGEQVTIPVTIENVSNAIGSYGLQIDFNQDDIEIINITPGYGEIEDTCHNSNQGCFYGNFDNSQGWIRAAWIDTSGGYHLVASSKQLFNIKIKVKNTSLGNKTFTIDKTKSSNLLFSDNDIHSIPSTVQNGGVQVVSDSSGGSANPTGASRQGDVGVGNSTGPTAKIDITRQTENNKKVDQVILDNKTTEDTVKKALEQKQDTVSIRISDLPNDLADEVSVKVPKQSVGQLSNTKVALNIQTDDVTINLPKESVKGLDGKEDDLFFRVVPIRKADEKQKVVENTLKAEVVKEIAGDKDVQVFGKPMTIETNYQNQKTFVTFSLKDVALPENASAREEFLKTLAVFIQHSDGEKVVNRGTIKYDSTGKPVGIEIEISKFSTFTIIGLPNTAPTAADLTVFGKTTIGEKLTATFTYKDIEKDAQGTSIIKWYRADDANGKNKSLINGAATSAYTLTSKDQAKYIGFEVTPKAKTGETIGKIAKSKLVGPAKPAGVKNTAPIVQNLNITGTLTENSTLKATYKYQDAEGDVQGNSAFKWYRVDVKTNKKQLILVTTTSTYKLTKNDIGKKIAFEVTPIAKTGTRTGVVAKSSITGPVKAKNAAPKTTNVKISGAAKVDSTLKVTYKYQDADKDAQGKSIIKWYRVNGKTNQAISGATKSTYKVTTKDIGKSILVEVTPVAKTGVKTGKAAASSKTTVVKEDAKTQFTLGVIKDKNYVDRMAAVLKNTYKAQNVTVKKEGSYYRLTAYFVDKKRANEVGKEMKKKKLIINYYVK